MDELDFIKAIPPEVAKAAYDDTVSGALKETGKIGQDLVKTLRLVLFPLQYTAALQDRLSKHLRKSIDRVPEDRRIAPIESLALPIAEQLRFHDEESIVGDMFVSLLARAMDRERVGEAHPAFVQIVSQLAPDEAVLIQQIAAAQTSAYMRPPQKAVAVLLKDERAALINTSGLSDNQKQHLEAVAVRPEELAQPDLVYTYIEHLVSLGIASYTNEPWNNEFKGAKGAGFDFWFIELNGLGALFHRACLSDS
ncbi:Abi-alpha family protein [Paraburkholderia sediminicola]|uniref:Abi-alpha family protein n=1 Tax=Paraburkholderia sediminicola TaxID=458836 RepID=UPI0038B8A64F